jgi:hypothetical protein
MTKKGNFLQLECTLAELGIELMVMKSLKNNSKMMLLMLFFTLGVDHNDINENHDQHVQLQYKYGVYQVHEICRSIEESK